jgi:hypothetical protein
MTTIPKLVETVETVLGTTATPETPPDPFNPDNLRLSQSFTETVAVKKQLITVPVRKPSPQDFVRVHPEYRENFPIIELKDEREEYIVTAGLVPELAGEFVTKTLFSVPRRQRSGLVEIGTRSGRVGEGVLDQSACEHEPRRL